MGNNKSPQAVDRWHFRLHHLAVQSGFWQLDLVSCSWARRKNEREKKKPDSIWFETIGKEWHQKRTTRLFWSCKHVHIHSQVYRGVKETGQLVCFTWTLPSKSLGLWHNSLSLGCKMEIRVAQGEMPGGMLFPLLWLGGNPSVSEEWKVCGVQKVMHTSLLAPLQSREWGSRG